MPSCRMGSSVQLPLCALLLLRSAVQAEVLSEFIDSVGGWRAAVVLGAGFVNVDAHVEYWHTDDKVPPPFFFFPRERPLRACTESCRLAVDAEK